MFHWECIAKSAIVIAIAIAIGNANANADFESDFHAKSQQPHPLALAFVVCLCIVLTLRYCDIKFLPLLWNQTASTCPFVCVPAQLLLAANCQLNWLSSALS